MVFKRPIVAATYQAYIYFIFFCVFWCFFVFFKLSPVSPPLLSDWFIQQKVVPPQDLLKHSYSEDKTENIYQVLN